MRPWGRGSWPWLGCALLVQLLMPQGSTAQELTGTEPTGSSSFLPTSTSTLLKLETLQAEADSARIHLGPLRLRPRLGIGGLGYTNNLFGTGEERRGDFTGSVTGGAIYILPIGRKVFFRGEALPQYNWFLRHASNRSFGWTNRGMLHVFVRRLAMELAGDVNRSTGILSSEIERPVTSSVLAGRLRAEYELSGQTALLGSLNVQTTTYRSDGLSDEDARLVKELNRTDASATLGVRQHLGARLAVGALLERGRFRFVNTGALRDNDSTGFLASVSYRGRVVLSGFGGYREFRATGGSQFQNTSGLQGGFGAGYSVRRIVGLKVYGRSELVNSLFTSNAVYTEKRIGVGLVFAVLRMNLTGEVERGANAYGVPVTGPGGVAVKRNDDVTTLRGIATLPLFRGLRASIVASHSRYTSNIPGFDRSITELTTNIGLGATLLGPKELVGP